jgi:hypothetical protein
VTFEATGMARTAAMAPSRGYFVAALGGVYVVLFAMLTFVTVAKF